MKIRKSKDLNSFDFTNADHIINRCKPTKVDTSIDIPKAIDNFIPEYDIGLTRKAGSVSRIDNPSIDKECNSGKVHGNSIWDSTFFEKESAKKTSKEISNDIKKAETEKRKELDTKWKNEKIPTEELKSIFSDYKHTNDAGNINVPKKDISINDGGDFSRFSDPAGEKIEKKVAKKKEFKNSKQKTVSDIQDDLIKNLFRGKNG